jgi:hypothetical protein
MSLAEITESVYTHLNDEALAPVYVANYESKALPQPPDGEHLKLFVLPLPTDTLGLVTPARENGLVQVNVFVKDGTGVVRPATLAQQVLDTFARGLKLTGVQFDVVGSIAPSFEIGGWYVTPVTIPYRNFVNC